jgi:hypothetical protein
MMTIMTMMACKNEYSNMLVFALMIVDSELRVSLTFHLLFGSLLMSMATAVGDRSARREALRAEEEANEEEEEGAGRLVCSMRQQVTDSARQPSTQTARANRKGPTPPCHAKESHVRHEDNKQMMIRRRKIIEMFVERGGSWVGEGRGGVQMAWFRWMRQEQA